MGSDTLSGLLLAFVRRFWDDGTMGRISWDGMKLSILAGL